MKGATLLTLPSTGLSGINFRKHRITFHDPERPEGIDNCTKDEVRGDLLQHYFSVTKTSMSASLTSNMEITCKHNSLFKSKTSLSDGRRTNLHSNIK